MYILVVDDDLMLHRIFRAFLAPMGLLVVTTDSPIGALAGAKEERPTLAVLDINNPQMDGNVLAERLWEVYPDLPVLFVTGGDFSPDCKGRNARLLPKPFSAENLLCVCKELLCHISTTSSTGA